MTDQQIEDKVLDLPSFIRYLENTKDSEWVCDIVRSKGNTKNCVMGHLVNYVYGKDYQDSISLAWDIFEEIWSTTFYIYEVNDGNHKRYPQDTPKARIIKYLSNLWLGLETPTWRAYELHSQGVIAD